MIVRYFTIAPVDIQIIGSSRVTTSINSSVTLACELYGYLPSGAEPEILWQTLNPSTTIMSSDPWYTISSSSGSRQIQNGGSSPRPSFISSLTIDVVDDSVEGTYLCSSTPHFQTLQLVVEGGMFAMYL